MPRPVLQAAIMRWSSFWKPLNDYVSDDICSDSEATPEGQTAQEDHPSHFRVESYTDDSMDDQCLSCT